MKSLSGWLKKIFINRNLALLWAGQVISQAGDSIFEIGLLWMMLELTGSSAATGLVAMAGYLPTLLFGLFMGALVDQFDRRHLMLFADVCRGLLVLLIPVLYFIGGLNGFILWGITFLIATFNSLFNPARDSLIPHLVSQQNLLGANSVIQTSWQFSFLIGPALAGLIIPVVGIVHLFNIDALTFFLSFLLIYKISSPLTLADAPSSRWQKKMKDTWRALGEGLRYARQDKRVWALLMITAIDNLFIMGPAIVGVPIFVREILQESADKYAFVQVAFAIGMITGTILLNLTGRRFRNSHILLWGIVLDGITFLPLLWVKTFWGMFLTIAIHSLVIPMIIIPRPTLIQKIIPAQFQGRIFSMISMAVVGFTALSMVLTGLAASVIPINWIYAIISIAAAMTGAAGWLIKEFRTAP